MLMMRKHRLANSRAWDLRQTMNTRNSNPNQYQTDYLSLGQIGRRRQSVQSDRISRRTKVHRAHVHLQISAFKI